MKKNITRREILKRSTAFFCLSWIRGNNKKEIFSCCNTPALDPGCYNLKDDNLEIDLKKALTIQKPGSAAYYINQELNFNIIIIKVDKNKFTVLNRSCTHAGRDVSYVKERKVVQCTNFSHSTFSLTGKIIKGPAQKALKHYTTKVLNNALTITLK